MDVSVSFLLSELRKPCRREGEKIIGIRKHGGHHENMLLTVFLPLTTEDFLFVCFCFWLCRSSLIPQEEPGVVAHFCHPSTSDTET